MARSAAAVGCRKRASWYSESLVDAPELGRKMARELLTSLLVAVAACSQASTPDACPAPAQMGCPVDAPTFQTGIADLLHARCYPCHAPGGVEQARLLTDYAHVSGERMSIASQVVSCSMPPTGAPRLTGSERQQILDWFSCGGPE